MKIFGKVLGKAIHFPLKPGRRKRWLIRIKRIGKSISLLWPSSGGMVNETHEGHSILLPGFEKCDKQMEVLGNTLIIRGEKEHSHQIYRRYGTRRVLVRSSFNKTLELPQNVDLDSLDAKFKKGVVQIHFTIKETTYKRLLKVA